MRKVMALALLFGAVAVLGACTQKRRATSTPSYNAPAYGAPVGSPDAGASCGGAGKS